MATVISLWSPVSLTSFYAPEDGAVRQARLWFYRTQTLDPVPVFMDANLAIPHSQPVMTGGSGRVPPVFVGEIGPYRVRAFDQFDVLLEDIDGLPPAVAAGSGGGGGGTVDPTKLAKTGQMNPFYAGPNQTIEGWVRLNGGTISSTAGPGSERANDDAQALFVWLWAADPTLAVIPNRGTSSAGDWAAAKAITLPDGRGRVVFGIDGQGFPNANRLTGGLFQVGDGATLGSVGGEATHKLLAAETPSHNHNISDPGHAHAGSTAANHTHTFYGGYSDSIGSHTHGITINAVGDHTHSVPGGGGGAGIPPGSAVSTAATQAGQTTGAAGGHTHSASDGAAGLHQHTVYGSIAGSGALSITMPNAVTGITAQAFGGDGVHNNLPPFLLAAWFMKL